MFEKHYEKQIEELIQPAIELAMQIPEHFSISMVQRKFRIGYMLAVLVVEKLEERGIVGPLDPVKKCRPVLIKETSQPRTCPRCKNSEIAPDHQLCKICGLPLGKGQGRDG